MKILLITQGCSRVVAPLCSSRHQVVGILESDSRRPASHNRPLFRMGKWLYHASTGGRVDLQQQCRERSVPYRLMQSSDDEGLVDWIRSKSPDAIVVFSMSHLLKRHIFDIPPLGTINLHPSYLPDYRGPNPCFWQYYHCELNPGVTVHYVNEQEDAGDIIFQERLSIEKGIRSPDCLDRLIGNLGVRLTLKAIDAMERGDAPRAPQPTRSPTARARNIRPEEHATIIKWQEWDGERVWHVLRGTESWINALPRPRGLFSGNRWRISDFERTHSLNGIPGELFKSGGSYFVATKDGRIGLETVFDLKQMIVSALDR